MLPKKNRIPARFFSTKQKPKRTAQCALLRVAMYVPATPISRVAVVIGKSVDKRAVVRNRIRRIVMDAVALELRHIPVMDYVFLIHKEAASASKEEMRDDIMKLLKYS